MFYSILPEDRPNMLQPKGAKDKAYHNRMGRAFISATDTGPIQRMHAKSIAAEKVFNDDVLTQEDIDTFMLDESGNTRNRTMFNFNMVKPIVEQYRGTGIQLKFDATVQPVTRGTRTRRLQGLSEQVLMHSLAEMGPAMRRIIGSKYNLGATPEETAQRFNSTYEDPWVKGMQRLLKQMVANGNVGDYPGDDMLRFAFCGVLPEIARGGGSYLRFDRIHPREFFWDTNAQYPDFSDADFMGVCPMLSMPRIAELWKVDREELKHIEESIRTNALGHWSHGSMGNWSLMSQTRVRVFSIYWIDEMYQEYGYIKGPGNVPTMVRVGDYGDGGKEYGGRIYTREDLIDPPDSRDNEELFKGEKSASMTVECVRFVDMIPFEYLSGYSSSGNARAEKAYRDGFLGDLVLDYGTYDQQEYIAIDPYRARLPIKATAYAIANGEIVSPVQAILSPNKFVDRVLSAFESQANMAGGKIPLVDMDLVDPGLDEVDVDVRRKQGRLIPLRAGGRGVSNAIGSHDDSMGSGAYAMLQVVQAVQDIVRTVTGVHEPMTGESQKDQLVGVTEILVQRGSLMQEGFYDAYTNLQLQKYRFFATAGKEYYLDKPDVLMDMIGDDDIVWVYQTRHFENERFNMKVERDNPERTRRQQANQWLDTMVQLGIVDPDSYIALYNNSSMDDVLAYLKRRNAELQQAQAEAQREQVKNDMLAALAAKEEQFRAEERDIEKDAQAHADTMAKEGAKEQANVTREQVKLDADMQRAQQQAMLAQQEPAAPSV